MSLKTTRGHGSARKSSDMPIALTAQTYNRFSSAADFAEVELGRQPPPPNPELDQSELILLRNDSAIAVDVGHSLRVTGVLTEPGTGQNTAQELEFINRWAVTADVLSAGSPSDMIVVATTNIQPSGYGRCVINGATPVWADLDSINDISVGVDFAATDQTILKGGFPGLPILWSAKTAVGPQWVLASVQQKLAYGKVVMQAQGDITARVGAVPGTGTGDLKYLELSSGEYKTWRAGETIRNWAGTAYADQSYGWAEMDGAGVWHAVSEECIPPPPLGIGSVDIGTPPVAGQDIPTGAGNFIPLAAWDSISGGVTPAGVTFNPGAATFSLDQKGIWEITLQLNFAVIESQSGRTCVVRLWNVTDALQPGDGIGIPVGRNQDGVLVTVSMLVTIDDSNVGDTLGFDIGEASATMTGINWITQSISVSQVRRE